MSVGAVGVVSVASNLVPDRVSQMVHAALKGDFVTARKMHFELYPLFKDLFIESNPAPSKAALAMMGRMLPDVRLPRSPLSGASSAKLKATLNLCGLL
jgi:4-hydroxy-tetrahydrodipicolinate synthase